MHNGRLVYFNGEFLPEAEAKVSIYDSALMFGDMVFEMTRSFNGVQFKLREHIERLYASIKYVQIPLAMSPADMEAAVQETIAVNQPYFEPNDEHRLMINVSRGLLSIYQDVINDYKGPNVIIADFPLRWTVSSMGTLFETGINAVIPSQRAIPAWLMEPKVKNRSRLFYLMANMEVSQVAGENNWALLLDPDGFIAEGTGANFFMVKDGKLLTPEGRNILRGISRSYIFELCEQLNLSCREANIEPYDLMQADEAFMTATPFCMLPVTHLNGVAIGRGRMGPLTKLLLDTWSDNVGVDIVAQIKSYAKTLLPKDIQAPTPYAFRR
jgi:branched-chain amino acid aminotransferase